MYCRKTRHNIFGNVQIVAKRFFCLLRVLLLFFLEGGTNLGGN